MFGLGRRARKGRHYAMPARPDGAPLRDGDTVLYPGYRRAADVVEPPMPEAPAALPAWAAGPTRQLDIVPAPELVRPFLRTQPWP